jgi:hypothetical protein
MKTCPCCSSRLLRHVSGHEVYWFCRHCWQVMPVLSDRNLDLASELKLGELASLLQTPEQSKQLSPV